MLPNIYKGDYRRLALLPLAMILISLYFIPSIKEGVDFQGGTIITLQLNNSIDATQLQTQLQGEGLSATVQEFKSTEGYQIEITTPQSQNLVQAENLKGQFNDLLPTVAQLEVESYQNASQNSDYIAKKSQLESIADQMFALAGENSSTLNISGTNDLQQKFTDAYNLVYTNYQNSISTPINKFVSYQSISVQTVSPVLSSHFIDVAVNTVILCVLLSLVLVFLFFRTIGPSIAVLTGALSDVLIAMGGMGLLGIPLTLASFAALLMLVGFSLDTDILCATRLLKRKGDHRENLYDAMKTGMTMSIMAIIAFLALFVLAAITHIPTYYEISAVALCGLIGDIVATWGIDAVIMLYLVERREGH